MVIVTFFWGLGDIGLDNCNLFPVLRRYIWLFWSVGSVVGVTNCVQTVGGRRIGGYFAVWSVGSCLTGVRSGGGTMSVMGGSSVIEMGYRDFRRFLGPPCELLMTRARYDHHMVARPRSRV